MSEQHPSAIQVEPLPAAALALALSMMKKLSHDLNNALLSSVSLLELVMMDHPEVANLLEPAHRHLQRPRQVLETSLRALPSRAAVRPRALSTWPARVIAEAEAIQVQLRLPSRIDGPVGLAEEDWLQCLDNLVRNALEAHELARKLQHDYAEQPWVSVEQLRDNCWQVLDNGPGCRDLPAAARGSARQGAGHLGLGLAVVATHLQRVRGTLTLAERDGSGLVATIQWPTI